MNDAVVTEEMLMRAKSRFARIGIRYATHSLLGAEPYLGAYILTELVDLSRTAGGTEAEIQRRTEELVRVTWIACEAMRLGEIELWSSFQETTA